MKKDVITIPNGFEIIEQETPKDKKRKDLTIRFLETGKFIKAEKISNVEVDYTDRIRQLLADWSATNCLESRRDSISIDEILQSIKLEITGEKQETLRKRLGLVNGFEICTKKVDEVYDMEIKYFILGRCIGNSLYHNVKCKTIDSISLKLLDWCSYNLNVESQASSISWLDMKYLIDSELEKQ